jgi:anaerobic ribonucleoside-triphosphate reductase activating protein
MLKYVDTKVVFQEVPNEITLAIDISNCPCHCEGCHSPYLADDIGEPLDLQHLTDLIDSNRGISCVCIMGGDANPSEVDDIAQDIKEYYPELKIAWYSGRQELSKDINLENFDYVKLGPYIKDKGPLNSPTTNQRFYKIIHTSVPSTLLVDQTHLFWKKDSSEK